MFICGFIRVLSIVCIVCELSLVQKISGQTLRRECLLFKIQPDFFMLHFIRRRRGLWNIHRKYLGPEYADKKIILTLSSLTLSHSDNFQYLRSLHSCGLKRCLSLSDPRSTTLSSFHFPRSLCHNQSTPFGPTQPRTGLFKWDGDCGR